jgi:hypothetical protein
VLARIYARQAALDVAGEGLKWLLGTGQAQQGKGESLANAVNLLGILDLQAGLAADMDCAADLLNRAFSGKGKAAAGL